MLRLCRVLLLAAPVLLGGCVSHLSAEGPPIEPPSLAGQAFVMPDGARLGYRVWRPEGEPRAIILALHGMNDSRDAWEVPAPAFTAAGIEIISPDQRGFGATAARGLWPGTQTLVSDARQMALLVHAAYPHTKLYLMGESMGAAVLICLAASHHPPPGIAGYILVSPAVWGRSEMNIFERVGLWFVAHTMPGMKVTGSMIKVRASDNRAAIRRLSTDPLTLHATRWDAVRGLVDLMDAALADAGRIQGPALFLYGGKDDLIPKRAARAAWRELPGGVQATYYPNDYHLMLRDLGRAAPIDDIIRWMDADTPMSASASEPTSVRCRLSACEEMAASAFSVMPGLVPGIHDFAAHPQAIEKEDVDGRHKAGHDEWRLRSPASANFLPGS